MWNHQGLRAGLTVLTSSLHLPQGPRGLPVCQPLHLLSQKRGRPRIPLSTLAMPTCRVSWEMPAWTDLHSHPK